MFGGVIRDLVTSNVVENILRIVGPLSATSAFTLPAEHVEDNRGAGWSDSITLQTKHIASMGDKYDAGTAKCVLYLLSAMFFASFSIEHLRNLDPQTAHYELYCTAVVYTMAAPEEIDSDTYDTDNISKNAEVRHKLLADLWTGVYNMTLPKMSAFLPVAEHYPQAAAMFFMSLHHVSVHALLSAGMPGHWHACACC